MPRITFQTFRDVVLLLGGLAVVAHEVLSAGGPRTELLTLAAAMVGLPFKFLTDRKFKIPGLSGSADDDKPPADKPPADEPPPTEPPKRDPA